MCKRFFLKLSKSVRQIHYECYHRCQIIFSINVERYCNVLFYFLYRRILEKFFMFIAYCWWIYGFIQITFFFFFLYIGGYIAFETWSEKSISQETFTHHCMIVETWQNNKKRNSRNWSFKKWSICFIDVANNFRILYIYLKYIESNKGGPIRRILGVLRILKF